MDMSLDEVRTLLALDLASKADCDAACGRLTAIWTMCAPVCMNCKRWSRTCWRCATVAMARRALRHHRSVARAGRRPVPACGTERGTAAKRHV